MKSIRDTGRWNLKARAIDMTGERYRFLTVVRRAESDGVGRARWLCACECGREAIYRRQVLRAGEATSCGCARVAANRRNGRRRAPPAAVAIVPCALAEVWR